MLTLTNKQDLDKNMNQLHHLDPEVDYIDFSELELEYVPYISLILKKFPRLTQLDLSENKLTYFPKELQFQIKRLELSFNKLKDNDSLPTEMPELISLDLTDNQFQTFPINILNYKKLKGLDLSSNAIRTIPKLPLPNKLIDLQLSCNKIYFLPPNLPDSIQILNLSCNLLQEIPNPKYLPKYLKILNLSNNFIQVLPDNLNQCQYLSTLNVDNNSLLYLPDNLPYKLHYFSYENNLQIDDQIHYLYPMLQNITFIKKKIYYINEMNSKWRTIKRTQIINTNLLLFEKAIRFYLKPSNIQKLFEHAERTDYYGKIINEIDRFKLFDLAFG